MDQKLVEKIKKLLALAGNNPSAEEAKAAMLKAQRLMAENNISMEAVDEVPEDEIINEYVTSTPTTPFASALALIISKNFRCEVLLVSRFGYRFFGHKNDVELAKTIFQFAYKAMDKGRTKIRAKYREMGLDTKGIAPDYCYGFIRGLDEGFKKQVAENCWALVVVPDEATKKAAAQISRRGVAHQSIPKAAGNFAVRAKGYEDGMEASSYRKRLHD